MQNAWQKTVPGHASGEDGYALIEVLISALVAALIGVAIFGLMGVSARQGSEERNRARAYAVAQEDQARMRGMRISQLNKYSNTRTVTQDNVTYTVVSTAQFVNDQTGTVSCGAANSTADYVKVQSKVTWPTLGTRPPTILQSLIAPPNGSLDPDNGTLTINAINAAGVGIGGVGLSGTGPSSFSGTTDSAGCAQFADIPGGNYTLTPTASGVVDQDGNAPAAKTISVIGGGTASVTLQFDTGGSVPVTFVTKRYGATTTTASSADTLTAFNTGMTQGEVFGTPGGTRTASKTATPLFPFTSPDTFYAGSCTGNLPDATATAAYKSVVVPAGGTAATQTIQLPSLNLTVKSGSSSSSPGSNVNAGTVVVYDLNCTVSGNPVRRTMTTNSSGQLADPGLPWSTYAVCASNGTRFNYDSSEDVKNLTSGTNLTLYMTGTGSATGSCP